ncbi:hypothetical protein P280DRAFT_29882 [Massarina eburnea CBS 473.64]|uniref:Uncharacterized protein n=1 Tax=Massarina eburnea CBS 473.64 TaxID=1395130 RepID=A0A6A6RXB9_9PLEO|nr:hypothetical protein P280DRAFT_29882 [Massarina eburnea CBS 473.64]
MQVIRFSYPLAQVRFVVLIFARRLAAGSTLKRSPPPSPSSRLRASRPSSTTTPRANLSHPRTPPLPTAETAWIESPLHYTCTLDCHTYTSPLTNTTFPRPVTANMPVTTRTKDGSLPKKIEAAITPSTTKTTTKTATKKRATANTSKPRDKKVATGRVAKPKTTTAAAPKTKTVHKEKAPIKKVTDKVAGTVKKAEGKVEGKPAKKAAGTKKAQPTTTKKVAAPRAKKA